MSKTTKIIVGLIIIALVVLISWVIFRNQPQQSNVIRIGFIGPLTGEMAIFGEIEKNTMALAVNEINKSGGVNGKQIVVDYEDGKCEGATALSAAQKLVELRGINILLVTCSQEVLPLAPYTNAHKVILWTSYASASGITHAGEYIFRNSYTNDNMAKAMADIAIQKGKTAAIITEESAFASDLGNLFVEEYLKAGGKIVANENFLQGDKDVRTQVSKIIAADPAVIVVNPNGPATGIALLQQLRQLGYKGPFVGNFFGGSKEVENLSEAQGMEYVSDPVFAESPLKQKVFADYEKMYGKTPDLSWPVGARYDAIYILEQAFKAVGTDPTAVKNYLHNMPKDFTGIIGTYRFDANDADITNVHPSIAIIKNNQSVLIPK